MGIQSYIFSQKFWSCNVCCVTIVFYDFYEIDLPVPDILSNTIFIIKKGLTNDVNCLRFGCKVVSNNTHTPFIVRLKFLSTVTLPGFIGSVKTSCFDLKNLTGCSSEWYSLVSMLSNHKSYSSLCIRSLTLSFRSLSEYIPVN